MISQGADALKVDLAQDSPFRFEPPFEAETGILVSAIADLHVDKLLAYYCRAEPRDAVNLYSILQRTSLVALLEQAAQKDPGFDLYSEAGPRYNGDLELMNTRVPSEAVYCLRDFSGQAW